MMRGTSCIVCFVLLLFVAGCTAGPNYLTNTADGWRNRNYEKNPILTGVCTDIIPLYGLVIIPCVLIDTWILNPVQFWGFDVYSGKGAAFRHKNPEKNRKPWFIEVVGGE